MWGNGCWPAHSTRSPPQPISTFLSWDLYSLECTWHLKVFRKCWTCPTYFYFCTAHLRHNCFLLDPHPPALYCYFYQPNTYVLLVLISWFCLFELELCLIYLSPPCPTEFLTQNGSLINGCWIDEWLDTYVKGGKSPSNQQPYLSLRYGGKFHIC